MPENVRARGLFATARRTLVFSIVWAVMGVTEILFTVVGHNSGGFAVIGVFSVVVAIVGLGASFELRRRKQPDSIR